eukprot:g34435.t1
MAKVRGKVQARLEAMSAKYLYHVLFQTPTDFHMRPCRFLSGRCRFVDTCKFSHGYPVRERCLRDSPLGRHTDEPIDTDLDSIQIGCVVLALYKPDGLWYRAKVIRADLENRTVDVKYDGYEDSDTLTGEEVIHLPVPVNMHVQDYEEFKEMNDDDDDLEYDTGQTDRPGGAGGSASQGKEGKAATSAPSDLHKGFGAKMLKLMGWKEGQGLGAFDQGRADVVEHGGLRKKQLGLGADADAPSQRKTKKQQLKQQQKNQQSQTGGGGVNGKNEAGQDKPQDFLAVINTLGQNPQSADPTAALFASSSTSSSSSSSSSSSGGGGGTGPGGKRKAEGLSRQKQLMELAEQVLALESEIRTLTAQVKRHAQRGAAAAHDPVAQGFRTRLEQTQRAHAAAKAAKKRLEEAQSRTSKKTKFKF